MSMKLRLAGLGGGAAQQTYVDDVFSTYLYTGNGSTQTITNGIDLAGKGGMVWIKGRTGTEFNNLEDTVRGIGRSIYSNSTLYQEYWAGAGITSFNSNGFTLGTDNYSNGNTVPYASWTFRKAAKFFDVVTYTGTGSARTIAHSLGIAPGMVIVKRTDTTGNWQVYSNGLTSAAYSIQLNLYAAQASAPTVWNSTAPTSSVFSVGTDATVNASGGTYVAYLFAHNTASDGIIQCGSYVGTGSTGKTVNLGWEPQFLLVKSVSVDDGYGWFLLDSMRGIPNSFSSDGSAFLYANRTIGENNLAILCPTATGFYINSAGDPLNRNATTYIYMAIRRPNKPPTSGTQVYKGITRTGTGAAATVTGVGFAPDLALIKAKSIGDGYFFGAMVADRLRGQPRFLTSSDTTAEVVGGTGDITAFNMDGASIGGSTQINYGYLGYYINWFFKRAPGFMDVVCYTGTGSATTQAHNLGVAPELMIVKARSVAGSNWSTYISSLGNTQALFLNLTNTPAVASNIWNNTSPTSTVFTIGTAGGVNTSGTTYVAYLFATLAGISKVGSYTGNGGTQNIDCGFAAGARFVLIKRTDSTGDWFVWDTARGIVAANDPHLSLNTTAAEVTTDDSIDPLNAGFTVNQVAATNINVSSATYIYLAIA